MWLDKGAHRFRRVWHRSQSAAGRGLPRRAPEGHSNANDNVASEAARGIEELEGFLASQPVLVAA